jgi:ribosomal protein L11 methyltransferase
VARTYPALDLRWSAPPDPDTVDRTLAAIDDDTPTAVEPLRDGIRVFFASGPLRDRAAARLSSLTSEPACRATEISDEDWAAKSQASLGPVAVGRIVVTPPWARGQLLGADTIEVVVLPSMGFGTGHHASTRLCLRLLQTLDLEQKRVLDVGTGSGVLALAAARLGARAVLAVDSDPDALAAAGENLSLNGMPAGIELRQLDLASGADIGGFDVVLANLTGGFLIRSAERLVRLAAEGLFIVSGFERFEMDAVSRAFAEVGWRPDRRLDEDTWTGLMLTSSPTPPTTR